MTEEETPAKGTPVDEIEELPGTPRTWQQVLRLARYQLRDYLRSSRFILMLAIVGILGGIMTAVLAFYRSNALVIGLTSSSDALYGSLWGGGIGVIIVFAGIIFGGDAIAGEFQNKTGYFLMGLPVRRVTVYSGKYIAAFAASMVAVVTFALIILLNGIYYLGGNAFTWNLLVSFLIAIAYLMALLGTVFLFSSLFKTSAYAILIVAVLFLFGFTIIESLVAGLVKIEPWFIISYASPVLSYPFDPTIPQHVVTLGRGPGRFTTYNPTYPEGLAIILGYFLVTTLVGLYLFEREEFT